MAVLSRRHLLVNGARAALGATVSSMLFDRALVGGAGTIRSTGRYGPLQAADVNGLRLPAGFTSRVIGIVDSVVPGTQFVWRGAPDGGACFVTPGQGWVYAANHELGVGAGGASAIRFDPTGSITDAYSILSGTVRNCSGGPTPWGTWLSCEENGSAGQVYECNPFAPGQGVVRPLLGSFNHEAAVVDRRTGHVYLTEDSATGRLYRFEPAPSGQVERGQLFAAVVDLTGTSSTAAQVTWQPVTHTAPDRSPGTAEFRGGEGEWIHDGRLLFTTKYDRRVWELQLSTQTLRVLHDSKANPSLDLNDVDAIVVHAPSGDVYVAEDPGNMELVLIEEVGNDVVAVSAFMRIEGHGGSEVTGTAFNPVGNRMYVSSQRGFTGTGVGITYEIVGPFARTPSVTRPLDSASLAPAVRLGN